MTIGERIALLRKQAGLSQEKLASLIGVSRQAIGKWESNLSLPGIDNLQELAAVLHVSCDELITGSSSIGPNNDGNGQIALESVKKLIEQGELANRQSVRRRFLFSLLPALLACVLALGCLAVSYFLLFTDTGARGPAFEFRCRDRCSAKPRLSRDGFGRHGKSVFPNQ